eukprot:9468556-Pyramimonas_sp.AAC.1
MYDITLATVRLLDPESLELTEQGTDMSQLRSEAGLVRMDRADDSLNIPTADAKRTIRNVWMRRERRGTRTWHILAKPRASWGSEKSVRADTVGALAGLLARALSIARAMIWALPLQETTHGQPSSARAKRILLGMLALPQRRRRARDGAALTGLPRGRILQVALNAARLVCDIEDLLYLLGSDAPQIQLLLNGIELFSGFAPLQQFHGDEHILRRDDHHLTFESIHPKLTFG